MTLPPIPKKEQEFLDRLPISMNLALASNTSTLLFNSLEKKGYVTSREGVAVTTGRHFNAPPPVEPSKPSNRRVRSQPLEVKIVQPTPVKFGSDAMAEAAAKAMQEAKEAARRDKLPKAKPQLTQAAFDKAFKEAEGPPAKAEMPMSLETRVMMLEGTVADLSRTVDALADICQRVSLASLPIGE